MSTEGRVCKDKNSVFSLSFIIILLLYLYPLFMPDRIKSIFGLRINGKVTTNEIFIIPIILIINRAINISHNKNNRTYIFKSTIIFIFLFFLLFIFYLIGGFKLSSLDQYIYAGILFFVPVMVFFSITKNNLEFMEHFLKTVVVTNLIYSILAILLASTKYYNIIMRLVGNQPLITQKTQLRPSLMVGTSIATSYYFNLSLPLLFYIFYKHKKGKWALLSIFAIVFNIAATVVLLSRLATFVAIAIAVYYIIIQRGGRLSNFKKIGIILIFLLLFFYIHNKYDLSRLLLGMKGSSVNVRINSMKSFLYIFKMHPIIGSGMGSFFTRVFDNSDFAISNYYGKIDPHNMYILVLSEFGLTGFIIFLSIFIYIFMSFRRIQDSLMKKTAYMSLLAFLLDAMGGSHLFISISYSTIFWLYMGMFWAISKEDIKLASNA